MRHRTRFPSPAREFARFVFVFARNLVLALLILAFAVIVSAPTSR